MRQDAPLATMPDGRCSRAGTYRAVMERRYPMEQAIEATSYVETGQKVGNVVLTVVDPPVQGGVVSPA